MRTLVLLLILAGAVGALYLFGALHDIVINAPQDDRLPAWQVAALGVFPLMIGVCGLVYRRHVLTEHPPGSAISRIRWAMVAPAFLAWALAAMLPFLLSDPILRALNTDFDNLWFGAIVGLSCTFVGTLAACLAAPRHRVRTALVIAAVGAAFSIGYLFAGLRSRPVMRQVAHVAQALSVPLGALLAVFPIQPRSK